MFDNTINYDYDHANRVLVRVNQDKYSSEYRYRTSDVLIQFFIRHTTVKPAGAKIGKDRHNVEFSITRYRADGSEKKTRAYLVLEGDQDIMANDVDDPAQFLAGFLTEANCQRLVAWES